MKRHLILHSLISFFILHTGSVYGQVDKFTGDFSQLVSLMKVPSPDGPSIPISVNYQAGITVDQPASEVGLGWGISAGGMVSRGVSGVPDDWKNVSVANLQEQDFEQHRGVLHFKDGSNTIMDFYNSSWKIDTPNFYFPDYDEYFVAGAGMMGVMQPFMFEYGTVHQFFGENGVTYSVNNTSAPEDFTKKAQFVFLGDYADTLHSRYYPESIDEYTTPIYPDEDATFDSWTSSLDFEGEDAEGYNTEYYTETANKNRLVTSRYVEYFTNDEIDNGVTGFINFESGHARSSSFYPPDAIGGFRITNAGGVTYHYSLPVYIDSSIYGNYPLDNDYVGENYYDDVTKTTSNNGYIIKDNDLDDFIIEYKEDAKYAYQWLLTAITGPKYVDSNSDGMVNNGDLGYWVSFDYQKWSGGFRSRYPFFGYANSFVAAEEEETQDLAIDEAGKKSGRNGVFSTTTQQLYYLNKIQTSTHAAIFVRDIRKDEHSASKYCDEEPNEIGIMGTGPTSSDAWYGSLYDNGGPDAQYSNSVEYNYTISPKGAEKIQIEFPFFSVGDGIGNYDVVEVYEGYVDPGNLIATYHGSSTYYPSAPLTSTGNTLVIKFKTDGAANQEGFRMTWKAIWKDKRPTTMPQLRLDKIVLLKNEDYASLPSRDTIVPSALVWDMDNTTNTENNFYSLGWYNDNSASIESVSLRTIDFEVDYSLARGYHNNINVFSTTAKTDNQDSVLAKLSIAAGQYAESGKLTLNEIKIYDVEHTQISPSYLFDYNESYSVDNPDYNPKAVDNWGYFKKDISSKGHSSYTTLQSKNYVDAWCLRKITSPLGGTIHIEYESDEYEKVFSESGGFKGPSRTYLIKDATAVTGDVGESWFYSMEDDVTDFSSLANNAPTGTKLTSLLPGYINNGASYIYLNNRGTTSIDFANSKVTYDTLYNSSPDATDYDFTAINSYNSELVAQTHYTGNGYFNFELPVGEKVYGGGVRVKRITINNCIDDTYRQEFTYGEGVTPSEPDRLDLPRKIKQYGDADSPFDYVHLKARAFEYDKHMMGPGVGYSSVTVKNMGQTNAPLGATSYNFLTDPTGIDNFEPTIVMTEVLSTDETNDGCSAEVYKDTTYIIDVSDKFTAFWGSLMSSYTTDINDNIVSKAINKYETTRQGVITENYHFQNLLTHEVPPTASCTQHNDIICIMRNYPAMLTQQVLHEKGVTDTTNYLLFDDVTWAPVKTKNRSLSQDVTIKSSEAAFRISDYEETGPKAIDQDYTNQLGGVYSSSTIINPDITGGDDFSSSTINTLKEDYSIRDFSTSNYKYENLDVTGSYWVSGPSYSWVGPVGDYGLYDEASFVAFNPSSIDASWRYLGETTLYDQKRRSIESKTNADRYSATKFGYDNKYPIVSGSNVNYESFTHTSFEDYYTAYSGYDYYGGEVKSQGETVRDNTYSTQKAHTGYYYVSVPSSTEGPVFIASKNSATDENLMVGRTYRASVWVHEDSPSDAKLHAKLTKNSSVIADVSVARNSSSGIVSDEWILISLDIEVPDDYEYQTSGDNFRVYVEGGASGTSYFDDLRVQPVEAVVNAVLYDDVTGRTTYTLDNNNFGAYKVYDEAGNVIQVFAEKEGVGFKKRTEMVYEYAR